jgi:Protein of unknown function (DUF2827)
MDSLPGMNVCEKGPADACRTLPLQLQPITQRKVILLATSTINNSSLFVNGLFQNVFVLYKLFDSMGYAPILLVNDKPSDINNVPNILKHVRMITVDDIMKSPMRIHLYLEIGMSIAPHIRKLLRATGARIAKLYLGNILNIDTETPMFYPGMHFAHHVVGELDEIWVSPHYKQHEEYAAVLNQVEASPSSMKIAPYVWDPCILTLDDTRRLRWRPRKEGEPETFVILEPNISFQKSALIPLLVVERSYRENKRPLHVLVGNSDRIMKNPFFLQTILPTLELAKDGMIKFSGRHDTPAIMADYPYATGVCHQWNNQYNYMTLEYLVAGFPVIHNAPDWHDVGYYYKGHDITEGLAALQRAKTYHESSLERYKSGAEVLRWRHSPYNPDVQKEWQRVLN